MARKLIYIFVAIVLIALRLFYNFSTDLIPGVNGGYYPLQVRLIIETASLGFSDMPLYFYFNAAIVWFVSSITTIEINTIIINTVKIVELKIEDLQELKIFMNKIKNDVAN